MATRCPRCNAENPDTKQFCADCGTKITSPKDIGVTKTIITPTTGLQKGSTFAGRYQLIEELGRGGMGVVYKAEDTKLKRTVALKFLPPELTHIPDVKDRFMREAQAAAALDHPNICTVYEFDEAEEKTFISMAYVEGQSLRKKLESGPLELDEALRIATQAAEGLQIAHKKGVVHRDIKSANIMVTEDNQAKIMDFGLARMTGGTLITQEGTAMGTIAYMSPEQAQGEEVDHRTDIWSLGVVLYEMFGGQLPFMGEHDQAVVYSILNKKPKPITDLRAEIPMSIGQVVDKALEKNPDERYQQIDELLDDLRSISAGIMPEEIKARLRKEKLRKRKRTIVYAGTVGLVIIIAVLALALFTGRAEAIQSIAVLPFENLTGDAGQEYFVDGVTDELIGQLGKISGLRRVISRTSAMKYKETDKSLSEIARELNVDAIVEGSVQQAGDRVRIQVRLIDALPEEQNLWGQTYERVMSDVLVMYSEMALAIADKTGVHLTADEKSLLTNTRQVDPEAYRYSLMGSQYGAELNSSDMKIGMQYHEEALKLDPGYAEPHAGIALIWLNRFQMGLSPHHEALPLAKEAAEKALELDSTNATAHHALACLKAWGEWDWEGAEEAFQRVLELYPNRASTYGIYAELLMIMGRPDEALAHAKRAVELDPITVFTLGFYGRVLVFARRYDDALKHFMKMRDTAPNHPLVHYGLRFSFYAQGMYEEVLEEDRFFWANDRERLDIMEQGYAEGGFSGAMKAVADLMVERSRRRHIHATAKAGLYAATGMIDQAFEWLETAFKQHDPNMPYLNLDPFYEALRDDPRFQELLRKMNLPVDEKE